MTKWREQCGDVFSLKIGPDLMVILSGYDTIKEGFVKNADSFSGRPFMYYDWVMNFQNQGLTFNEIGWKEQRSIAITILRNMGMGKNTLAEKIDEEVDIYLETLATMIGKPVDFRLLTGQSVCNVISGILTGQRFDYEDEDFKRIIGIINYNLSNLLSAGSAFLNIWPMFHYLPGDIFGVKQIVDNRYEFIQIFTKKFADIRNKHDYDEALDDSFIANYLREEKVREKHGHKIDQRNLYKIVEDLFGAGTETTSTTINWFVVYMIQYPEVQEKIFKEIMSEVGTERRPTMQDRTKLKYVSAAISETQRLANVAPMGVMHKSTEDSTFKGYHIPQGSQIISNLSSVMFDKDIWGEDVDVFRPERFLDDSGNLKHFEQLIPFSVGRRACPGEALARMELYLYIVKMCQRFQFLMPDPSNPPEIVEVYGITRTMGPFEVKIIDRRV